MGNEELVGSVRWGDQGAQEIDFVLADGSPGLEGVLTLLALLCGLLSLLDCSLSSSLTPSSELLLSGSGSGLVLLAGKFLLLLEIFLALFITVSGLLSLLLYFLNKYLLFVLQLSVPCFSCSLSLGVLAFLRLLLS